MDFLNPEEVLNNLDLKENMTAAEFGCGAGTFSIYLAKKVPEGKVYGLDVQEEKLSVLKNKATLQGITNIVTVLCDLEKPRGSTLSDNSLDIVLIPNILFQAEKKDAIIEEGKRILKPGGQLLVIDWAKKVSFGPQEGMITAEEVKKIAEKLELRLIKEFSAGAYHHALLFTK